MRRLLTVAAVAGVLMLPAGSAHAANASVSPVLVLANGHVHVKRERFLGPTTLPAGTRRVRPAASAAVAKKAPRGRATRLALDDLLAQGAIDQATRDARQVALR